MKQKQVHFGTDGWRGILADDFTDENVRIAAGAIAHYVREHEDPARGLCIGYVAPESFVGGPLALVRAGDRIRIDAPVRRMDLLISEAEFEIRRRGWTPPPPRHRGGALAKYARLVGQAPGGAVTHAGAASWPWFDQQ